MVAPSKIVVGPPRSGAQTEHIFAYRHNDDAPRLVATLAARISKLLPAQSDGAGNAARCLEPRTPWRERLRALESALHDVTDRAQHVFTLWDADALATFERERFDVERASLLRRDLYQVVRRSAENGGWILVRTARTPASTLDDLDLPREVGAVEPPPPGGEPAGRFAPECQPLAAWLLAEEVLRPRDLDLIKDTVGDADGHLVDRVYGELPGRLKDAAKVLSTLRAPQKLNGAFGSVEFSTDSDVVSATSVPAATRDALTRCGLLQSAGLAGTWRMPRVVRDRIYPLARMTLPTFVADLHRLEAEVGTKPDAGVDVRVEAHHHAVAAGDAELAKETAHYYGSELAEVARELSLQAQAAEGTRRRALFEKAASLYQHVLDHFDATDAYAWEYLGYNLARADGPREKILHAYAQAHRTLPGNPLYHGRWLGYRALCGEDISAEAIDGIMEYAQEDPAREPVSYFARAVFDGLRRAGRADLLAQIERSQSAVLRALAPSLLTES